MQKLFVLAAGVAAAVGLARAEDPETLGFWTFNGENGTNVTDSRETVTIPNLIERTDSLKLDMVFSTAGNGTAPLPTYTNDVQYAYLFDGFAGDNLLATCATSIQIKPDNWASTRSDGTWERNHAYFVMRDVGALIKDRDWTLEMIMHAPIRGGWTDFIQLGTNTANKSSFLLRTSGRGQANYYSTSTSSADSQNGGNIYPKYDTEAPAGVEETVYLTDDKWHHVALQWTESTKVLTLQVDYGQAAEYKYWSDRSVNLELDDLAKFTLFGYGTYHNAMPTVQAIRLTRGTLPRRCWMRTSVHRTAPETAYHYRFDGEDQLTNSFFNEVSQPRRSDLRLWKHLKRDTTLGFFDPEKPFVKLDGGLVTNMSVVGNRPGKRFYLDCVRTNPAFTTNSLGESFTHEFFFNFATNYISKKEDATQGGAGLILAEFGGTGGSTDWSKTNWALIQTTGSKTSATASLRLDYYLLNDAGASSKPAAPTFSVSTNEWHHFALTYDAPSRKLVFYIDYAAKYTKTFAANERLTRGTSFCPFGNAWLNQNDHVFGAVDEWRISRRALSPDEFIRARNGGGLMLLVR